MISAPLSRPSQVVLNGRALVRDLRQREFAKLRFHWLGLWRALAGRR
jgi:hypothetical protein